MTDAVHGTESDVGQGGLVEERDGEARKVADEDGRRVEPNLFKDVCLCRLCAQVLTCGLCRDKSR